jgi:hypothetical protein
MGSVYQTLNELNMNLKYVSKWHGLFIYFFKFLNF